MLKLRDPIVLSFKETCGEGVLIVCMFSEVHVSNVWLKALQKLETTIYKTAK